MKKHVRLFAWLMMFVLTTCCKEQVKTDLPIDHTKFQYNYLNILKTPGNKFFSKAPNNIVRNIAQDRNGNIWMATWEGVFRYDGKSFTNVTSGVSSARFFSVLEDRKGNLWFGSIGSGVYYFDGKFFQRITTREGLPNNEITSIYEDKAGNIWFGTNGGASRYDPSTPLRSGGKSFRNFMMAGDSIIEDKTGKTVPDFTRPPNEVTSIIEDKTGRFWFGTRGNTFLFDGKTFSTLSHQGRPFTNVRTIIEDEKGRIWLGGMDGLWRYDPAALLRAGSGGFTQITQNFVGYIHEDKKGNLWTSAETAQGWVLSRYDAQNLSNEKPIATEINPNDGKMLFGILEANDGSIWFGADGVYRYDARLNGEVRQGNTITDFKD